MSITIQQHQIACLTNTRKLAGQIEEAIKRSDLPWLALLADEIKGNLTAVLADLKRQEADQSSGVRAVYDPQAFQHMPTKDRLEVVQREQILCLGPDGEPFYLEEPCHAD